jgi:hypothetical protein
MKCKLCGVIIVNAKAYRNGDIYICEECKNEVNGYDRVIIKDGKFLVEQKFLDELNTRNMYPR